MSWAHPFFVAAHALLGLAVAFHRPLANGQPVPFNWDTIGTDLRNSVQPPDLGTLQRSAVGHQPSSTALAHPPHPRLDHSLQYPQQPLRNHQELPNTSPSPIPDDFFDGVEVFSRNPIFRTSQGAGIAHQPSSTALAHTRPWLDHGLHRLHRPLGNYYELLNTFYSSNLNHDTSAPPNYAWNPNDVSLQGPSALHPVFTPPQGLSSALPPYQHATTQGYDGHGNSASQPSSYSGHPLSSDAGGYAFSGTTHATPRFDSRAGPSSTSHAGGYGFPARFDGARSSEEPQLLSPQRFPELQPPLKSTSSSTRQAKRNRGSRKATDSGKPDDSVSTKRQRIPDKGGRKQYTYYHVGPKDPGQTDSMVRLINISSHRIGDAVLEAEALKEFRKRVLQAYPSKAAEIAELEFNPAPKVDTENHMVDNGYTVEQTRSHLTIPFRNRKTLRTKQQADEQAPTEALPSPNQELAQGYDANGYAIKFIRYRNGKKGNFYTFSIVGRKGEGKNAEKVWVGDIDLPESIWGSEELLQPGSEHDAQLQQAPSTP